MTERRPPDDPADEPDEDENPEFDRFEALTKKLLGSDEPMEGFFGTRKRPGEPAVVERKLCDVSGCTEGAVEWREDDEVFLCQHHYDENWRPPTST